FRAAMAVRPGREWDKFEGLALPPQTIEAFLKRVPFAAGGPRRLKAPPLAVPEELPVAIQPVMATQTGFGAILNELGRQRVAFTERIVTASPDVTVSTNLGPWVNRRGLFAREAMADTFKRADDGPWRQSEVLQEPRVQLKSGLNRTKGIPTSVPTTRPQSSRVSCAAGRARP